MKRPPRTVGDYEALEAARLMRDHGARLAEHHARECAELERAWDGPSRHNGHARFGAELEKRAAIRAHELARRGWRDDTPTPTVRGNRGGGGRNFGRIALDRRGGHRFHQMKVSE